MKHQINKKIVSTFLQCLFNRATPNKLTIVWMPENEILKIMKMRAHDSECVCCQISWYKSPHLAYQTCWYSVSWESESKIEQLYSSGKTFRRSDTVNSLWRNRLSNKVWILHCSIKMQKLREPTKINQI